MAHVFWLYKTPRTPQPTTRAVDATGSLESIPLLDNPLTEGVEEESRSIRMFSVLLLRTNLMIVVFGSLVLLYLYVWFPVPFYEELPNGDTQPNAYLQEQTEKADLKVLVVACLVDALSVFSVVAMRHRKALLRNLKMKLIQ